MFRSSEKEKSPRTAKDFFIQYLEIKDNDHFEKIPHKSKSPEMLHEHYDQYYNGIKVEGAGYNFHYKSGQMYFANGHYVKIEELSTTPDISAEEATQVFLKYLGIPPGKYFLQIETNKEKISEQIIIKH